MSAALRKYGIALSFAGAQREYVKEVAKFLTAWGVACFYDNDYEVDLWGETLTQYLHRVYLHEAQFAIVFVSLAYSERVWTRHEFKAVLDRVLTDSTVYLLPVRFDDTNLDGLSIGVGYQDARKLQPIEIARKAAQKLGLDMSTIKADNVPSPFSEASSGFVTFDFTNHNGTYLIGHPPFQFETRWSNNGAGSIHAYNDGPSVIGVAVATEQIMKGCTDASKLDFTSRSRSPRTGEYLVIQHIGGVFAVLKMGEILAKSHGAPQNSAKFEYKILLDGSRDLTPIHFESNSK